MATAAEAEPPVGDYCHDHGSAGPDPRRVLTFLRVVGLLKDVERTGWVNSGVHKPESVSDHMYRMAMAALVTQDEDTGVDHVRAMKMALVHDITEAIVGDITPQQPITEEEKHARERRAAEQISDVLGGFASGSTVLELWREYEAAETPCARLIKDIDKFEMCLQAHEYEGAQSKDLEQFFRSVRGRLKTPTVKRWFACLEEQRAESKGHMTVSKRPTSERERKKRLKELRARGSEVLSFVDEDALRPEPPPSHVARGARHSLHGVAFNAAIAVAGAALGSIVTYAIVVSRRQ